MSTTFRRSTNRPKLSVRRALRSAALAPNARSASARSLSRFIEQAARRDNVAKLAEYYGSDAVEYDGKERFALVCEKDRGDEVAVITMHATFDDACLHASRDVLDGWDPIGVFDLDTGELINLHVSSPVVTRSEDQRMIDNPLEQENQ
jgi:hypothetical protein